MYLTDVYRPKERTPIYRIEHIAGDQHPYRLLAGYNGDRELVRSDDYAMVHMALLGIAQFTARPHVRFYWEDGTLRCSLDPGVAEHDVDAALFDAEGTAIYVSQDWTRCYLAYLEVIGYEI